MLSRFYRASAVFALLGLATLACTREELKDRAQAMRPKAGVEIADDLGYQGLVEGLSEQSGWLRKTMKPMQFGPRTVEATAYADRLDGLVTAIQGGDAARYLQDNFDAYEVYGNESWGQVKLTSYFEPVIKGSRVPSDAHPEPLLGRPEDLLTINTSAYWEPIKGVSSMRGRLDPGKPNRIVPYFSRKDIYGGALRGRNLELAYVDPIDGFFMQVQGSGTIELDDGAALRVGYADQNGHPYVAIGRFLVDVIDKDAMSMDTIIAHLRTLTPERRAELMANNPSYVFFEARTGPALTSNTTAVVDGRTIATDAKFFPKGAIALLTFDSPSDTAEPRKVTRLVIDQDTGGAIRGGGRVDLFWGRGPEAGRIAGAINQSAKLHYLVPK